MITYQNHLENISADKLRGFFVGWPNPPDPVMHLKILRQSSHVVLAIDDQTDKVIGFINAISDNCLSAYIPLLEVVPEYQKRGIGGELVTRMLAQLENLYMIDLTCDPAMQNFYAKYNLVKYSAMMVRNFDRQSGT